MDRISTEFYVVDNTLHKSKNRDFQIDISNYHTYEVMRCTKGVLVFMSDHLKRMRDGLGRLKKDVWFSMESARKNLDLLLQQNMDFEGNVKLLGRIDKKNVLFAAYGIPHNYPEKELYEEGILMNTIPIERPDPLIKQVHVANTILEIIGRNETPDNYESLLVDHEECITEGSKSNFFLVRDDCLFSAPEDTILRGITREYIKNIAEENGISVIHQKIAKSDLGKYEAAFICGTSPKILPVRRINTIQYNPEHPINKILMESFDILLENYVYSKQGGVNNPS